MRLSEFSIALAFALAAAGLLLSALPARAEPTQDMRSISTGNNAFAADIYAQVAATKGNLFFSPYSIYCAIGMADAGARGQTAKQIDTALHFSLDPAKRYPAFGQVTDAINTSSKRGDEQLFQLWVANALWLQKGYPLHEDYLKSVKTDFRAQAENLDFQADADAARKTINDWVEKQTKDKIKDLLQPGTVDAMTRLVLTNAIYFKSAWADPFDKDATQDDSFTTADAQKVTVPMMNQQKRLSYLETGEFQAVQVPYRGHALSMLIVLPRKADGLGDVERSLTAENLDKWMKAGQGRMVKLSLPRFKIAGAGIMLNTPLQKLGITDAFDASRADFSGMATVEKLAVSGVVHKAFIDVNEEGTEAAAATAMIMAGSAMPRPEEPVVFKADHPFVLVIYHRDTNAILFVGRLTNPN